MPFFLETKSIPRHQNAIHSLFKHKIKKMKTKTRTETRTKLVLVNADLQQNNDLVEKAYTAITNVASELLKNSNWLNTELMFLLSIAKILKTQIW